MGKSNGILESIYKSKIKRNGKVAVLGATSINYLSEDNQIDYFDLSNGWNINCDWNIEKKYDLIICTRCLYFCKDPEDFFKRCYESLKEDGQILIDFGLGHHWTKFKEFKIGWVKNGEHESEYKEENYLWSCLWDKKFENDEQFNLFCNWVRKFNYPEKNDVLQAIYQEVPVVINLYHIEKYFDINYELLTLWKNQPQLYIFIDGVKKK
jgi:SAM-dependent methyltransferase